MNKALNKATDGTRRRFLKMGLVALAGSPLVGILATPALASIPRIKSGRALEFHNLHTDEKLSVTYWRDGSYDRTGMAHIMRIMRDHYSGEEYPISPSLMDLLYDLQSRTRNHGRIEIISGYRSPRTNLMLASYSRGVAKNSYHTKGMAIDIRIPGTSLARIHNVALAMRKGGVGYYPDSQFVHVDVGPVRRW